MSLSIGTRLGAYEIAGELGAGGMGEVYRARDTRLGRDVALKVLPEAFAADAERMARFEREAKVLASLNHPNIGSIYGFEESGGVRALVMELVEGPTLAERVGGPGASATYKSKGTPAGMPVPRGAIPVEEALAIAKQICEGLEYAHERGIVHRDLKPANVKITPEGTAKILDFGLAKALEGESSVAAVSTSPTISRLATQAGIILGTAAYMSPEQAKGKPVDRRADIWAFGCVLYEMLTAKRAFDGETVTDILAAVVRAEPDWSLLPVPTPAAIRDLLARCLRKDAKQRLRDIGDARIAIEEALSGAENEVAAVSPAASRRRALPWVTTAVVAVVAGLFAAGYVARSPQPAPPTVTEILPPEGQSFALSGSSPGPPVLSPDGRKLVFALTGSDGKQKLWVRPLGAVAAQPLEGTEGATFPFWSPDGRSLGFFAHGKLNRIEAAGGPAIAIAAAAYPRGGAWGRDGTILYAPNTTGLLYRVAAAGGTPAPATKLDASRQEFNHRWPQFLPDGKHFLFYAQSGVVENSGTYAGSLEGGEPRLLVRNGSNAVYAEPGYLLFIRQGTLMAQRFDAGSLRLAGDAVPLAEHVESDPVVWRGIFTVSENGMLAYVTGDASSTNRLLWYDRSGKQIGETGAPSEFQNPSLSPDGRKLAVGINDPVTSNADIWVYDLTRESRMRLTFSGPSEEPAWSPDGKMLAFVSSRSGANHLYEKAADGTGKTMPLVVDDASESYPSWSSDGRYLIFDRTAKQPGSRMETCALPLSGNRKAFPVAQNQQFGVSKPALSPDGEWLAYVSAESGQPEIYVVPFLNGSGRWEVSTGGGTAPRWRRDGKELFYLALDNKLMAAEISKQGPALAIGKVAPVLQTLSGPLVGLLGHVYDVGPDGQKFVVVSGDQQKASQQITLVVNWPVLLKKQ